MNSESWCIIHLDCFEFPQLVSNPAVRGSSWSAHVAVDLDESPHPNWWCICSAFGADDMWRSFSSKRVLAFFWGLQEFF